MTERQYVQEIRKAAVAYREGFRQEKATAAAVDALVFGRLAVFQDSRYPEIDGKPARLQIMQLRFLQILARHPDRWTSRPRLAVELWRGRMPPAEPNATIDTHAWKLRKALIERLGEDPIETGRGLGYRLNLEALRGAGTDSATVVARNIETGPQRPPVAAEERV